MAIASQTITASAGVVVTQGVGATSVTGTLKTALVGDTTSVIILTASDVTFLTTKDVIIGSSTTVAHTDVVTATNNGLHRQSACQVCTVGLYQNQNAQGKCKFCAVGTYQAIQGQSSCTDCSIGRSGNNEWTLVITAQDITQTAGVTVTQGSSSGTLKTALTGSGMINIVIKSITDSTTFDASLDVVINPGGGPETTVVRTNVISAKPIRDSISTSWYVSFKLFLFFCLL